MSTLSLICSFTPKLSLDKSIEISNKGITVVISNHSTDYTTELYSTADNIVEFPVKRNNAAKAEHRKVIMELLVTYKSK